MLSIKFKNKSKTIYNLTNHNYISIEYARLFIHYDKDTLYIDFDTEDEALLAQKKIEFILQNKEEGFFILENLSIEENKTNDIVSNVNMLIAEGIIYSCRHIVSITKDNKTAADIMKTSGYTKEELTKANNNFRNFFNQKEHLQSVIDSYL